MRSSAKALLMVGRSLGANISSQDIESEYDIDNQELSLAEMSKFLVKNGVEADVLKLDSNKLLNILKNQRVILRLNNDRTIIAVRSYTEDGEEFIVIVDPTDNTLQPKPISSSNLMSVWSGNCLAAKSSNDNSNDLNELSITSLMSQLIRDKSLILPVFILSLFGHFISLTPIILLIITLDKVIGYEGVSTLYVLVFGVCISFAFGAIFRFMRDKSIALLGHKIHAKITREAIESTLDLSYPYISANNNIVSQMVVRVDRVRNFIKTFLSTSVYDFIGFIVFIPLLASFSLQLFFILIVFTLIGIGLSHYGSIVQKKQRDNFSRVRNTRTGSFRDIVDGLETIKSLGIESRIMKRWFDTEGDFIKSDETFGNTQSYWRELTTLLQNFLSVSLLFFGALLVLAETIPVGAMLGFYLLSQKIFTPLTNLSKLYQDVKDVNGELEVINRIVSMEKERGAGGIKPGLLGTIKFDNVSFGYPGTESLLKNISLDFPSLSFIGITGPSGVGKSTIVKLMQKFYRPITGMVTYDNNDLRTIDPSYLRSNVSVVTSRDYFSNSSIKENLMLPLLTPDIGRMDWAIDKAGAREFIKSLDQGVETKLTSNASNISSGQKQLLALARGLITNPKVIILDDALTQLGPETEFNIIKTLQSLKEARTVILISNQVWHLQLCDKIIVLEDGGVKESGGWNELMSKDTYIKSKMNQLESFMSGTSTNTREA